VNLKAVPHGTRGDIQPMLALADALARRRHAVRFIAPANVVPWIAARGFEARSDGIDVEQLFRTVGADFQSFRWQADYLSRVLTPQLFESVAAASDETWLLAPARSLTAVDDTLQPLTNPPRQAAATLETPSAINS